MLKHRKYFTSGKVVTDVKCVEQVWFSSVWRRHDEICADVVFPETFNVSNTHACLLLKDDDDLLYDGRKSLFPSTIVSFQYSGQ